MTKTEKVADLLVAAENYAFVFAEMKVVEFAWHSALTQANNHKGVVAEYERLIQQIEALVDQTPGDPEK